MSDSANHINLPSKFYSLVRSGIFGLPADPEIGTMNPPMKLAKLA
jgi:hypothetical protein